MVVYYPKMTSITSRREKIRIGTGGYEKAFKYLSFRPKSRFVMKLNTFSYPPVPMRIFFASGCYRCHFWIVHNHILSRKKKPDQKILFYHEEILILVFGFGGIFGKSAKYWCFFAQGFTYCIPNVVWELAKLHANDENLVRSVLQYRWIWSTSPSATNQIWSATNCKSRKIEKKKIISVQNI